MLAFLSRLLISSRIFRLYNFDREEKVTVFITVQSDATTCIIRYLGFEYRAEAGFEGLL